MKEITRLRDEVVKHYFGCNLPSMKKTLDTLVDAVRADERQAMQYAKDVSRETERLAVGTYQAGPAKVNTRPPYVTRDEFMLLQQQVLQMARTTSEMDEKAHQHHADHTLRIIKIEEKAERLRKSVYDSITALSQWFADHRF